MMKYYSIIVPTFNSAATIKKCLDSIVNQTWKDFEVIVVDGLSSDRTKHIVEEFVDERIIFFSEKDKGAYDAMNKGIDKANGKWLLFLGSDDSLFDHNVLAEMNIQLRLTDAKFVYGNVKIMGNTTWAKDGDVYKGETSIANLFEVNICHQGIFYANEVFSERKRYNLRYIVCADYDFNLYCASKFEMSYCPIIISYFNAGGISSVKQDPAFEHDKWQNIVVYFQRKLMNGKWAKFRNEIKKTIVIFLKQSKVSLAYLALRTYLFYKWNRL